MQFCIGSHAVAFGLQWTQYGLLLMPQGATRAHVDSIPQQPRDGVGKGAQGGGGGKGGGRACGIEQVSAQCMLAFRVAW